MKKPWTPKLTAEKFKRIHEGEWFEFVDFEFAREAHARNIESLKVATEEYFTWPRQLRILLVHGSGRSGNDSCAYEVSNSKVFLDTCMKVVAEEYPEIEVDSIDLRGYAIEPCNGCVSTCSALCNFPCTCFPLDPMQEIYPKVLRSDLIFCSTGVNQSTMSTRLKAFCDRLISLDGGFFVDNDQFAPKDADYKDKMLALSSSTKFAYDQRLYGRVGAYFISSKDEANPHQKNMKNHLVEEMDEYGFVKTTAFVLKDGMEAYGFFHNPNYYAATVANSEIDYMYDKETMSTDFEAFEQGRQVIRDAINLSKSLKEAEPNFTTDRFNRT